MGAKQILSNIKDVDAVIQIGKESVVVELKSAKISKGKSYKNIARELKKASEEEIFIRHAHSL